ncbi:MAG TPA: putative lipid II flippase FtsW [Acidimicrobiales bacterium]|nr:putative lipid II flippase FtsW [Acidimicrobiales bacterium]
MSRVMSPAGAKGTPKPKAAAAGKAGKAGKAKGAPKRPTGAAAAAGRTTFVLLGAVVTILLVTGVVMVLSASSVQSLKELGSSWSLFIRHLTWLTIGVVALVVTVSVDYRRWRTLALPMLAVSAGLLVLVLVPGLGLQVNGARSWIGVGSLTLQPSEIAKLALILFVAELLSRRSSAMADSRLTLRPVLVVAGAIALLVMLQPDLGTTMVLGALVLALLYVGGVPLMKLGATAALGGGVALFLALRKEYRRDRLLAFLDPGADPESIGYQISQSLTGVASGRLTGVGLGASRSKWGFLPNAHTDFIFAIIGEETGLIGALVVVTLFVAFAVLGVRAALHAPDRFGTLVAAGITAWVVSQALVNIGGVVGLLPITGLTLPFVSFGGTSLVVTMAATGILLNIARAGRAKAPIDLR